MIVYQPQNPRLNRLLMTLGGEVVFAWLPVSPIDDYRMVLWEKVHRRKVNGRWEYRTGRTEAEQQEDTLTNAW